MPRFAIVGQFARPPARQILDTLPINFELTLIPEPSNEWDPKAIKVAADLSQLPTSFVAELARALDSVYSNFTASELCSKGLFHLGYIPNSDNPRTPKPGNREAGAMLAAGPCVARFNTFSNGFPCVDITPEGEPDAQATIPAPTRGGETNPVTG